MILQNKRMQANARADTDRLVAEVDPHGALGFGALVSAARLANGAVPRLEEDLQAILSGGLPRPDGVNGRSNGTVYDDLAWYVVETGAP